MRQRQTKTSDLNDLLPLWERKLPHSLHQPDGLARRDMNSTVAARREHVLRNGRLLTQDIVGSIIVRQRRVQG